jgi:uncharacterized damage-inducible protein DinB
MSTMTVAEVRESARKLSAVDYPGTIRAFYPFWDAQYRPFLIRAVEALPVEQFDFKPRPEMMTARQLALHIAEAESWWIRHIVEGGPYVDWVVEIPAPGQGFTLATDAPDHARILAALEQCHAHTRRCLDRPASELSRVITHTREGAPERRFTLHWILDHLQEHEIHHRAQLNTYLRLMGITPPSI